MWYIASRYHQVSWWNTFLPWQDEWFYLAWAGLWAVIYVTARKAKPEWSTTICSAIALSGAFAVPCAVFWTAATSLFNLAMVSLVLSLPAFFLGKLFPFIGRNDQDMDFISLNPGQPGELTEQAIATPEGFPLTYCSKCNDHTLGQPYCVECGAPKVW